MPDAAEIIHRDHLNLDKVLSVLWSTVDPLTDEKAGAADPNALNILNSIVYYIRTFPDRLHHPKEEKFLFPLLLKHRPEAGALIAQLEEQHQEGESRIQALYNAVTAFDKSSEASKLNLRISANDYIRYQRQHIGLEESELLPMARKALSPDDWKQIQKAFASDNDPLFGENMDTGFRVLFERITKSLKR